MEGCTASGRSFAQRPTRSHVNVGESFRAARCRRAGSAQPSPRLAAVLRTAGPSDEPPDYSAIDAQPLNKLVYSLFRRRMAAAVGSDSPEQGYAAIIDMTRRLNEDAPRSTQAKTRSILRSLFPPWLPPAFKAMFARPLPELSCRLNAWATWLTCAWLMGPCEINDVEVDGGAVGHGHGVLVKRCRYLEEAGCASVCINSCKVPTQTFFIEDMGLPLTMDPNYEDFSCQFSFGRTPQPEPLDAAFGTACFAQCAAARRGAAAPPDACPKVQPREA